MYYQKIEIHEAAHAVIAVNLEMPFARIIMTWSQVGKVDDIIDPPGITNLEGNSEGMRFTALAGCVAADYFERVSPQQIWLRDKFNKTLDGTINCRVLNCLETCGKDKKLYELHRDPMNECQFDKDIEAVEKMIEKNWAKIERVASQLYQLQSPKSMSRDEVVKHMNLDDC